MLSRRWEENERTQNSGCSEEQTPYRKQAPTPFRRKREKAAVRRFCHHEVARQRAQTYELIQRAILPSRARVTLLKVDTLPAPPCHAATLSPASNTLQEKT